VVAQPSVAFNPLPWYMAADGRPSHDVPPLPEIYRQIADAGFDAVHAEVPRGMPVGAYRALLADCGLAPAPGYLSVPLAVSGTTLAAAVEDARRAAAQHAELGLSRMFIGDGEAVPARITTPARGAGSDPARLDQIVDALGEIAAAMVAEGVTPCLHQHVGTRIETPEETCAVMDRLSPDLLLFGPDTGHLAWAGADPVAMIDRYIDRIGAVHLKDVRSSVSSDAQAAGRGYYETMAAHLWTEPGRGDVDLAAVLRALSRYEGWFVIEVDIPDQPSPSDSAIVSAQWARDFLRTNDSLR
jgi:inosose dehydratase